MISMVDRINDLPEEIINLIKECLPKHVLAFTNKKSYILYHHFIRKTIYRMEDYIRDTIRRDNLFVFEFIIAENYEKWVNRKNYHYRNIIFNNYLSFITHYCVENNSDKCKNFTVDFLKEHGLCKNQHKKNIVKHIRWRT
jgi:hypothetical protein